MVDGAYGRATLRPPSYKVLRSLARSLCTFFRLRTEFVVLQRFFLHLCMKSKATCMVSRTHLALGGCMLSVRFCSQGGSRVRWTKCCSIDSGSLQAKNKQLWPLFCWCTLTTSSLHMINDSTGKSWSNNLLGAVRTSLQLIIPWTSKVNSWSWHCRMTSMHWASIKQSSLTLWRVDECQRNNLLKRWNRKICRNFVRSLAVYSGLQVRLDLMLRPWFHWVAKARNLPIKTCTICTRQLIICRILDSQVLWWRQQPFQKAP